MILELEYEFQLDKQGPVQTSWTYFYVKGDDLTKARTKAKTYFKKFISQHSWNQKVKLVNIDLIKNANHSTPEYIIVNRNELPPARERRSTRQSLPSKRRTSSQKRQTSSSQRTRTSTQQKKKS